MTFLPITSFFRRNAGQKLLSIALASALWWYVAGESQVQVGHVVPLEIRHIPRGLVITNKVERQVEVRLSAPPSLLSSMKPYQVGVTLDLADLPEGRHAVPLSEKDVSLPTGVKVSRIFPPVIDIQLERVLRRTLPVNPNVALPPGLPDRPFRVEADPPVALVEATAADLARFHAVETETVYPDRNTGSYTTDASLEAPGGHAKILEPRTVRVRVTFRERDRR